MPLQDEPTSGEMWRRMDDMRNEMRSNFDSLNKRLDIMPTTELMMAHMATQESRIKAIEDDVSEIKTKTQQARAIAISAAIGAAGVVVAAIGLLQGGGVGG